MTNIISELQESNKKLIEENENLKKQLADKEENLRLKIWHVTGQSLNDKGEVSMYAPRGTWWYKNLNKKWTDEGKLRMAIDPQETREWAKNCKRVWFDNITIEEMLEGFIDYSNDLASEYSESWSKISDLNTQKIEQKEKYENQIAELELKNEELETKVEELDDEVWMEREEAEKALNTAMKWRKHQMFETVLKHDAAMGKLLDRIDLLENNLLAKNQEINWRDYLATKELPALPKQQKENRLHKLKKLVSKVKEKTKEKFQTFIVVKKNK
jgi:hypothetical protein